MEALNGLDKEALKVAKDSNFWELFTKTHLTHAYLKANLNLNIVTVIIMLYLYSLTSNGWVNYEYKTIFSTDYLEQ